MGIDKLVGWKTRTLYIESIDPIHESDFEGDVGAYNLQDAAKQFKKEYPELGVYTESELIDLIQEV